MQQKVARTLSFLSIILFAVFVPRISAAEITVEIHEPPEDGLVGLILTAKVTVTSEYALESVIASVGDRAAAMYFDEEAICTHTYCLAGWIGELSLEGLPKGDQTVTVTATDVYANTRSAVHAFFFDEPPMIVVHSPAPYAVARPGIYVQAECIDPEGGCTYISVVGSFDGAGLLANGVDEIDAIVSLDAYDGDDGVFHFYATDSVGNVTRLQVPILVESSVELLEVVDADGRILDATARRVLFAVPSIVGETLFLLDRRTEETVELWEAADGFRVGVLGDDSALAVDETGSLSEFDGLEVRRLADDACCPKTAGHHAIWSEGPLHHTLVYRDLALGSSDEISSSADIGGNDVATNGSVVFWTSDYKIWQYEFGENSLFAAPGDGFWLFRPVTDGHNIVYMRMLADPLSSYDIILQTADDPEFELSSGVRYIGVTYIANHGWVVFARFDIAEDQQLWLRSPTRDEEQVTFFGSDSYPDTLGADGELMFFNRERRYLVRERGVPPLDVGAGYRGFSFQHACDWYVAIGNTLFVVGDEIPEIPNEPVGGCGFDPELPDEEPLDAPDYSDSSELDASELDASDLDVVDADDLDGSPDSGGDEPDMGHDPVDLVDVEADSPDTDTLDQLEPISDAEEEANLDAVGRESMDSDLGHRERVSDREALEDEESVGDGCSCSMNATKPRFPLFPLLFSLGLVFFQRSRPSR